MYVLKWIAQNIVPLSREDIDRVHRERMQKIVDLGLKWITAKDTMSLSSDEDINSEEERQEIMDSVMEELEDFGELE